MHVVPRYDRHELQRPRPATSASSDGAALDTMLKDLLG
jgi:hypothetical protein